jgi:hypothetical protein
VHHRAGRLMQAYTFFWFFLSHAPIKEDPAVSSCGAPCVHPTGHRTKAEDGEGGGVGH